MCIFWMFSSHSKHLPTKNFQVATFLLEFFLLKFDLLFFSLFLCTANVVSDHLSNLFQMVFIGNEKVFFSSIINYRSFTCAPKSKNILSKNTYEITLKPFLNIHFSFASNIRLYYDSIKTNMYLPVACAFKNKNKINEKN
jgi:hypothetical protein